jgi:hypothetical protein
LSEMTWGDASEAPTGLVQAANERVSRAEQNNPFARLGTTIDETASPIGITRRGSDYPPQTRAPLAEPAKANVGVASWAQPGRNDGLLTRNGSD